MLKAYKYSKIGSKLNLGFSILIILMLFVSAFSVLNFQKSAKASEKTLYDSVKDMENIRGMQLEMANIRKDVRMHYNSDIYNPAGMANFEKSLEIDRENYKKIADDQIDFLISNGRVESANEHEAIWNDISNVVDTIFKQVNFIYEGRKEEADDIANNVLTPAFNKLEGELSRQFESAKALVDEAALNMQHENSMTITIIIVVTVISVIIALLISIITSKGITMPITEITNISEQISKGNLNVNLPKGHKGEIQHLSDSLSQVTNVFNMRELHVTATNHEKNVTKAVTDFVRAI